MWNLFIYGLDCFGNTFPPYDWIDHLIFPLSNFSYQWHLSFTGVKGFWLGLVVFIASLALYFSWYSTANAGSRSKRSILFSLRTFAIVMVVFMAIEPRLEFEKFEILKNKVALIFDDSRSMSVTNGTTGVKRVKDTLKFVKQNSEYFNRLEDKFDVQYFLFSDVIKESSLDEIKDGWSANGDMTNIGAVLNYLKERYDKADTEAFLLFTDGNDTSQGVLRKSSKENVLNELAEELPAPLYTFCSYDNKELKDIAITKVEYDEYAFVRNDSTIKATINVNGSYKFNMPVTLKQGNSLISSQLVPVVPVKKEYVVDFKLTPNRVGTHVYSISVPFIEDELLEENNNKEFVQSVVRDRIRILHLCGKPSWDLRFLRHMLKQVHNIDLVSFYILKSQFDISEVPNSEMSLIPFPINELFTKMLDTFDLVIFQNFDYRPFDIPLNIFAQYFTNLKKYVFEDGGAFLMIGGDLAFLNGGYENTLMKDILPVDMGFGFPEIDPDAFKAVTTSQSKLHPVGLLDSNPENNEKIWKNLPFLQGCNKAGKTKNGAVAIAVHPSIKINGENLPIIAVGNMGNGRSAAIMTDSLWKWDFQSAAEGGTNRDYLKLWNNMIKWLTHDPDMNFVNVSSDKTDYKTDQVVKLSLEALDSSYRALKNQDVDVDIIKSSDGKVVLSTSVRTGNNGKASLDFKPKNGGFYKTVIRTSEKEGSGGLSHAVFYVEPSNREFEDLSVNEDILSGIATSSGGKFLRLPMKSDIDEVLQLKPTERFKPLGKKNYSLWDNWIIFVVLAGLFVTEWWLRFKVGLS